MIQVYSKKEIMKPGWSQLKRDNFINMSCFICFIYKKFAKLRDGHSSTFETVNTFQPLNMFIIIDTLSGRRLGNFRKKSFTFIITKCRCRKITHFRQFSDCVGFHEYLLCKK